VGAGGGDVVQRTGLGLRHPRRQPVRGDTAWMLPPCVCALPEVLDVNELPADAESLLAAPVAGMTLPSRITCGKLLSGPLSSAWRRSGA
jgi:hypothetical protein